MRYVEEVEIRKLRTTEIPNYEQFDVQFPVPVTVDVPYPVTRRLEEVREKVGSAHPD